MSVIGQPGHATQNRIIRLFKSELGYRYLGDWSDREGNSNIEEGLLADWLSAVARKFGDVFHSDSLAEGLRMGVDLGKPVTRDALIDRWPDRYGHYLPLELATTTSAYRPVVRHA